MPGDTLNTPLDSAEKTPYIPSITLRTPGLFGRPNIYGAVNAYHAPFYAAVGAMSLGGNVTGHAPSGVSSGGIGSENVVISGRNSSSIYKGEFNTVQPPALRALALIRAYESETP